MRLDALAVQARAASHSLATLTSVVKNRSLSAIRDALQANREAIVAANREDLSRAEAEGLAEALLKRLRFGEDKLREVCEGLDSLIGLDDPVGQTLSATTLDDELELYRVTCPIGVVGVIFESRPDALVQISSLCLKSGNAVLLKGGSEASQTNRVLAETILQASSVAGVPAGWLGLLETRSDVTQLLALDRYIDLIVPRGSNEFVRHIMENTSIPVLGHADGICHVYIDAQADEEMGVRVAVDSKVQYVAVCNAVETLLVHQTIAGRFLPRLKAAMDTHRVELRGCERTRRVLDVPEATEADWRTEYLDLVLSIRVVDDLDAAIDHINTYGSGHTDAIITMDPDAAHTFLDRVDSANVFWNCSTRFADGFRYGLGAEVGISTNKIHARGPVGLEGLLIYKFRLCGAGQVVADFTGDDARPFKHQPLNKVWVR